MSVERALPAPSMPRPRGGPFYPLFLGLLILSKFRRRWIVLSGAAVVGALLLVPSLPKSYASSAVIQVRKSLSTAISEDVGLKPTEAAGQITEDYREVQTGLLESRLLHEAVGRRLLQRGDLGSGPSLRGQLRELVLALVSSGAEQGYVDDKVLEARRVADSGSFVGSSLKVRRGHKSPKLELSFTDDDPARARQVLELLLEEYQASLVELYDIAPLLAEAEGRLAIADAGWVAARDALSAFEATNDLQDPDRQIERARATLSAVVDDLIRTRLDSESSSSRVEALTAAAMAVPAAFQSAPSRIENRYRWMLLDLLTTARKRLVDSPFLEGTPEYQALQAPAESLAGEYAAEAAFQVEANPVQPNSSHYKVVADLALARADEQAALASQEILCVRELELRAELERLSSLLAEHQDLNRRSTELAEVLEQEREHVLRLRRVKELGDADLLWSYKVLQAPTLPTGSAGPSRAVLFLGLVVFGCGLALLLTLASGLLDPSVREARELERLLGVGPLAVFPDLGRPSEVARLLGRIGRGFLGRLEGRRLARRRSELFDFSQLGPHSVVLESRLDALISRVESNHDGESPLVYAVGGAHAGVGATTIAVNLARRLAERRGGRTLLALRRTGSELILAELQDAGIVDVLLYSDEQPPATSGEWREGYDRVVVDTPPALASRQSLDLLAGADMALLVARGDVTSKSALQEAVHAIENAGSPQVGLVLNAFRSRVPDALASA